MIRHSRFLLAFTAFLLCLPASCKKSGPAAAAMPAFPVKVEKVTLQPVGDSTEFLATLQSRNAAVLEPEVEGQITKIFVVSGAVVKSGQPIMEIDPRRQQATVNQQRVQLHYFTVHAPSDGVIGDIPVRVGDRVTNTTTLTTLDRGGDLEAYINVPAERSSDAHNGIPVELLNADGTTAVTTQVNFVSPRVDPANQLLLLKAPVPNPDRRFRNDQLVHARVIWKQINKPMIPVTALSRLGAQSFVFLVAQSPAGAAAQQKPVKLGALIGNSYVVEEGLNPGDTVIVGGTQNLVDGMPIVPQA